jgi:hypothetical protein
MKKTSVQVALLLMLFPILPMAGRWPAWRPALQQCANSVITSPVSGDVLRGSVGVFGSASIPDFQFYKVEFAPSFNPDQWAALPGSSTYARQVTNGRLDVFDTARVPDGTYGLKLTVVDRRGQEACQALVRGLRVANTEPPTPTTEPTVEPTASPELAEGTTQAPETMTPVFADETPTATPPAPDGTAGPTATPTRMPSLLPDLSAVTDLFNPARLREAFMLGVAATASVFLLVGLVIFIRRLL